MWFSPASNFKAFEKSKAFFYHKNEFKQKRKKGKINEEKSSFRNEWRC